MPESLQWAQVGARVRDARIGAGLSQAELATALSLDRTMVAKIEAGTRRVDALELTRLASVLGVPLDHFLHAPPLVLSRRTELTEDTATDAGRQVYRLEALLEAWARDVRQLVEFGLLELRPLHLHSGAVTDEVTAREAALRLRKDLSLGDGPIPSLMDVCEQAGQYVLVADLPGDGASMVDGDLAVAVVSRSGDPGRRRATAAHELAHMVLGDAYSSDIGVHTSLRDREAVIDAFAAELLLPSAALSAVKSRDDLVRIAAAYRTSWSTALRQAGQVGVVDKETAREWRLRNPTRAEMMDAVGWAPQPDLELVRVPRTYASAAMAAWKRNLLTAGRLTELLHGQISEGELPVSADDEVAP